MYGLKKKSCTVAPEVSLACLGSASSSEDSRYLTSRRGASHCAAFQFYLIPVRNLLFTTTKRAILTHPAEKQRGVKVQVMGQKDFLQNSFMEISLVRCLHISLHVQMSSKC